MPKGKVGYGHKSMDELRPLIGEIETLILNNNPTIKNQYYELKRQLKERDLRIKRICESQKIDPKRYLLTEKYMNDFHRRIGTDVYVDLLGAARHVAETEKIPHTGEAEATLEGHK